MPPATYRTQTVSTRIVDEYIDLSMSVECLDRAN
jgi:hypothetical protein